MSNPNSNTEGINPLVDLFIPSGTDFFQKLDSSRNKWDDKVADSFHRNVTEKSKENTRVYLEGLIELYCNMEHLLEVAEGLTSWKAGLGGALSFIDIGMLAERGISRLFFNRDDHRL